jgi:hypothetical protein
MPETLDKQSDTTSDEGIANAHQELETALVVQRQRREAHKSSDFNFGEEGYRPGAAGELRMIGRELKDGLRVIRAKRALKKSH